MRPIRIALYGDVNLNIVDGSAIWLASLTDVLRRVAGTRVTVLRKAPERRDVITTELAALPGVRVVGSSRGRPLTPDEALDELDQLDRATGFDIVVVRGFALARAAARRPRLSGRLWTYLTDIEQDPAARTADDRAAVRAIAEASDRLLCQTEQLRGHLEAMAPAAAGATVLLPPMVAPAFTQVGDSRTIEPGARGVRRLCYAGKFAPAWGVLEMIAAFAHLRARYRDVELHVAGDKIHDPPGNPAYRPRVFDALRGTDGVVWHGALPRAEVAALLADADIALSARGQELDESLELSTKLLEYGAAGVPPVCNRIPMHVDLLGRDYPLFVDDLDDLAVVLDAAIGAPWRLRSARDTARAVASAYTYDRIADVLAPHLRRRVPDVTLSARSSAPRVLVAGHDRKFFTAISEHLTRCGVSVCFDDWQGHARHDEAASWRLLAQADVVVCEWALGNAVWYSHHVRPDQRLIVRLHRMELETAFPRQVAIRNVASVVVVSKDFRDAVVTRLGWPEERVAVVPNWVDTLMLDRPKLDDARFHLGLLGWLPRRKRLDRALDVIAQLARTDARWRLHLAGPLPWELPWVWARPSEREYFTDQLDRIRTSPVLQRAVSIDGAQRNVAAWLRAIGWILSPSDDESFHLAPAEGMASGAVPVLWPWRSATEVYGHRWVCVDATAAAARIAAADWDAERRIAQRFVQDRYGLERVVRTWADLVGAPTGVAA